MRAQLLTIEGEFI